MIYYDNTLAFAITNNVGSLDYTMIMELDRTNPCFRGLYTRRSVDDGDDSIFYARGYVDVIKNSRVTSDYEVKFSSFDVADSWFYGHDKAMAAAIKADLQSEPEKMASAMIKLILLSVGEILEENGLNITTGELGFTNYNW